MAKFDEIRFLLRNITQRIEQNYDVREIVLFGSYAWGKPDKESDIDLAIVLNGLRQPRSYLERIKRNSKIATFIKEISIEKPIDFLIYSSKEWDILINKKSDLICEIENSGVKLYEKNN